MYELGDIHSMIQSIKPERGCMSSVVYSSPDGLWWVSGKYYPEPGGAYVHPVMCMLNDTGGSRPGIVYVINTLCPTCEAILKTFPQFDHIIVRS